MPSLFISLYFCFLSCTDASSSDSTKEHANRSGTHRFGTPRSPAHQQCQQGHSTGCDMSLATTGDGTFANASAPKIMTSYNW